MADRMTTPGAALVTGAGRRIGRALALTLAELGYDVGVHYNGSRDDAAAVVREIERLGRKSVLLPADLRQEDQVMPLIARTTAALGPVTCLVNNASIFERDEALDATKESWDTHQAINLRAPFVLMQEMARALPAEADGVIVNLLDQRVWNLTPHFISYTVSKTGLWTLTQTLALALAPRIRVNAIGPGPTLPSPPIAGTVRCAVPCDAARSRNQPRRNQRCAAADPGCSRHDWSDDRARWRAASRLGVPHQ